MESRAIGPFEVSPIGFGCMTLSHAYGTPPDAAHGRRILNEALDAGYTMLDTAALYGFGANETLIAEAIGHRRHEYVLASKCALHGENGKRVLTNDPDTLRWSCEQSLERLGTDVIDLFYLHVWDDTTPVDEIMRGLDDLVRSGKLLYIGISDTPAWIISKANMLAELRGWSQFCALQLPYSLMRREPERDLLPMARAEDLAVTTCFIQARYGDYDVDGSAAPKLRHYLDRAFATELVTRRLAAEQAAMPPGLA